MNRRQKSVLSIVFALVVAAGLFGLFRVINQTPKTISSELRHSIPNNWQSVDAGSFTLSLPPGWEFNVQQGIDSYVAEFIGDGVRLGFDYGWYSNPLADESDPSYVVTYDAIDGKKAKIVVPKEIGNGTTGVYFEDVGDGMNRLEISGENLTSSQQDVVLTIFRSIQFTK